MKTQKIKIGIIGVSGYGGGELARILSQHPMVDIAYVTSNTYEGKALNASFPGMSKRVDLTCEAFDQQKAIDRCDFIFLAGEAGMAMKLVPGLLDAGKKIVDLSGDFRLKNPAVYEEWYKLKHTSPDLIKEAVFGMPELNRDKIKQAKLVANPGCYPTSAILALIPVLKEGIIKPSSIIIDSTSGMSGAGRSKSDAGYLFAERNENLEPYGAGGVHKHIPEIEQILSDVSGKEIVVTFTPHLAPVTRGILTTAYADLNKDMDGDKLHDIYQKFYESEPFVVIAPQGKYPATKHALGSNSCHIGATVDRRSNRAIIFAAEDNLVKGMAGQAIQNMNLMCGFEETCGLNMTGLWP